MSKRANTSDEAGEHAKKIRKTSAADDASSDSDDEPVCYCGLRVKVAVCRSPKNAGRTYEACPRPPKDELACGWFEWLDTGAGENGGEMPKPGGAPVSGNAPHCNCHNGKTWLARHGTCNKAGSMHIGRDYFACFKGKERGCGFFEWDGPHPDAPVCETRYEHAVDADDECELRHSPKTGKWYWFCAHCKSFEGWYVAEGGDQERAWGDDCN